MKNLKVKVILAVILVVMSFSTCFAFEKLTDIEGTKYEIPVYALRELNLMDGYPDDTFLPSETLTRAQMVMIIVNAYGLTPAANRLSGSPTGFTDVDNGHWASGYICIAKDYGFIDATSDKKFNPDDDVTYVDAITYCLRILGYKYEIESKGSRPYNYIAKAQDLKLLKGLEINSYSDSATRGNVAILLWNVMNTRVWEIIGDTSEGVVAGSRVTLLEAKHPDKVDDIEELIEELTEILPTGITLSKSSTRTCIGANGVDTKLRCSVLTVPTITPENATDKTVTWTSSNNSIVGIENGYIIAKQKGSAVLTAKTINGLTANCNVEIVDHQCYTGKYYKYDENTHWQMSICNLCLDDIEKTNVENHTFVDGVCKCGKKAPKTSVSTLEFETDIMNLELGRTKQLNLKITPNEANEKITYTSNNKSYVTVDSNGKIKAIKAGGIATITAKTESGKTATCKVVVPKGVVSKMVLGTSLDKVGLNSDDVWVSSDESVVAFEGEKYVAKKLGKCTLIAYLKDNPNILTAKVEVEVVETLGSMSIEVKGGENYTLNVGDEIDVEAEIISTVENDNVSKYKLTWKSSDSNIVTVKGNNRKAKLTAKSEGTCNVVVSHDGMKTTIKVNVVNPNPSVEYDDVKENDWFEESVTYVTNNNLMNGIGDNKFSPSSNMTRGMIVTVLYRMSESSYNGKSTFVDVKESEYYSSAVAWAAENEIVNGIGDNKFAPNEEITREQLIVILYRYAKVMKVDVSVGESTNILSYDDFNEIAEYSISAFQWGCGEGIISGRTSTTLSPKGNASRAEVATMLMRFMED